MNDCSQTKTLLVLAADGELGREESAWLEQHVQSCPACQAEQTRFQELDWDLAAYGESLSRQTTPRTEQLIGPRPRVAARQGRVRASVRWMPQLATALAAALFLGVILVHRISPISPDEVTGESFVPIPYVQPLGQYETATVMRMGVPVAALIAIGYKVDASDPTAVVKADVLVGEDGRAHAVRVLSGLVLN
jgi:predicted anti-sigma-YlaC factor YlaD